MLQTTVASCHSNRTRFLAREFLRSSAVRNKMVRPWDDNAGTSQPSARTRIKRSDVQHCPCSEWRRVSHAGPCVGWQEAGCQSGQTCGLFCLHTSAAAPHSSIYKAISPIYVVVSVYTLSIDRSFAENGPIWSHFMLYDIRHDIKSKSVFIFHLKK